MSKNLCSVLKSRPPVVLFVSSIYAFVIGLLYLYAYMSYNVDTDTVKDVDGSKVKKRNENRSIGQRGSPRRGAVNSGT